MPTTGALFLSDAIHSGGIYTHETTPHLWIGVTLQLLEVEGEGADQWLREGGGRVKQLTQLSGRGREPLGIK